MNKFLDAVLLRRAEEQADEALRAGRVVCYVCQTRKPHGGAMICYRCYLKTGRRKRYELERKQLPENYDKGGCR